jgi:hypothetical protein
MGISSALAAVLGAEDGGESNFRMDTKMKPIYLKISPIY